MSISSIAWGWVMILPSLLCSALLMLLLQQPLLRLFYDLIPGEKSSDGPIFVFVAYLLCVPLTLLVFFKAAGKRVASDDLRFTRAFAMASLMGPALMVLCAAASAVLARLPAHGH